MSAAGEAGIGLLLHMPGHVPPELGPVLATGAVMAVIAPPGLPGIGAARALCREHGIALLVAGEAGPEGDGVELDGAAGVAAARRRLGPDALIGAACGESRHAAMVAGEDGADYVIFAGAAALDLSIWWSELFVLPCGVDLRPSDADPLPFVAAGADFIAVLDRVWDAPSPADAARELARGMKAARQP